MQRLASIYNVMLIDDCVTLRNVGHLGDQLLWVPFFAQWPDEICHYMCRWQGQFFVIQFWVSSLRQLIVGGRKLGNKEYYVFTGLYMHSIIGFSYKILIKFAEFVHLKKPEKNTNSVGRLSAKPVGNSTWGYRPAFSPAIHTHTHPHSTHHLWCVKTLSYYY